MELILLLPVIPELWNMLRGALRDAEDWFYKRGPERTFEELYEETMGVSIQPPPDHQIVLWTTEERDALGQSDLLKWMHETDQVLEGLGTDRSFRRSQMTSVPGDDDNVYEVCAQYSARAIRTFSNGGIIR